MKDCPFCRNPLNPGATACGHCGSFLRISTLSSVRKLVALVWILFGLFLTWALFPAPLGPIILVLSLIVFVIPSKVGWTKH
jgi:ABC-type Mn2+/Zn2+ transport system permease subunit